MRSTDTERLRNMIRGSAELKKKARQTKRQCKRRLEDKEKDPDKPRCFKYILGVNYVSYYKHILRYIL